MPMNQSSTFQCLINQILTLNFVFNWLSFQSIEFILIIEGWKSWLAPIPHYISHQLPSSALAGFDIHQCLVIHLISEATSALTHTNKKNSIHFLLLIFHSVGNVDRTQPVMVINTVY